MDLTATFSNLAISIGLGLLVGLQREQASVQLAGLRTFAIITALGTICSLLATIFGGWVIAAGFLSLTGVLMTGHVAELKVEKTESGVTTEVAALTMFGVGAYLVVGYREVAIAAGGGVAVLLQFKGQLHGIAARLGEDSKSIMQFALISMVILPILPNQSYGPYGVLNPRQIWLMVVLIVGIGLGGYIVYKFFGEKAGLLLAGVLGGIISSTVTTVTYSRRTKKQELTDKSAAIVILIASTVSCALTLIEIGAVAPDFFRVAVAPLSILVTTLGMLALVFWFLGRKDRTEMSSQGNPSELKGALYFALLYTLILFAIAAVKDGYGARGLYVVAAASGLVEVHALALSTAQLVETGRVDTPEGWRVITIALVSNLAFKVAIVMMLGGRLWTKVTLPCVFSMAVGIGIVLIWH